MIIMTSVLRIIRESYDIYIKSIYKRKIHQFQNVDVHSQVRNRIFNVQIKTTIFHTRAHVGQHENTNHVNRLVFIISTIYRLPYFRKINTVVRLEIPRMLARKLALAIRRTKRNPLHSFTRSTYRVIYRLLAARWITSFRNIFPMKETNVENHRCFVSFGRILRSTVGSFYCVTEPRGRAPLLYRWRVGVTNGKSNCDTTRSAPTFEDWVFIIRLQRCFFQLFRGPILQ